MCCAHSRVLSLLYGVLSLIPGNRFARLRMLSTISGMLLLISGILLPPNFIVPPIDGSASPIYGMLSTAAGMLSMPPERFFRTTR